MTCPYLAYRESSEEVEFDQERAFCTVIDAFVQPMRADICNDRYDLHHAEHCEYYLEHEAANSGDGTTDDGTTDDGTTDDGTTDDGTTADESAGGGTTTDGSTTNETPSEQERVEEP